MLLSEGTNETTEKPAVDLGDEGEVAEQLDDGQIENSNEERVRKGSLDTNNTKDLNLPTSLKPAVSTTRTDAKRVRITHPRPSASNANGASVKRDPVIESIIETRKFSIIDNTYTRLAQLNRPQQRTTVFDIRPATSESETKRKERVASSHIEKKEPEPTIIEYSLDGWDEGINEEIEKDNIPPADKTCVQLYEEKCRSMNICPCTIILRTLNTTKINLTNYGLGPRGCAPLAVGLLRNTTVLALLLGGNNIGNAGMTYLYQIITENAYIEEYDLSYNGLGPKGNEKLAKAIISCSQLKSLNVAGNELTPTDLQLLLEKLEDHSHLKNLNLSHNKLDEEGGEFLANWIAENHTVISLDASWCSIRLKGAVAMAKAIAENNRLEILDLSYNSFTNQTVPSITNSLTSNSSLSELNLRGSHFISRYDSAVKENPDLITTGKNCQIYDMLVAAATNESLKLLRLGENHIHESCLMIMLESLAEVQDITLEELDLTGIMTKQDLIKKGQELFANHPRLKVYVGPVKQVIDTFANNLLSLIRDYRHENEISVSDMFIPNDNTAAPATSVTYEQFLDVLREAKIPFPKAMINDIMKHLGQTSEEGTISIKTLQG
ncbi:unnamed protein product [Adineta ricciae]|uniref:Uncharacterized protein n=1 Tax=Adineta ricciae TaxID=249248 RepID=A0A815KRS1_ADIRI|nr:unnamed protein product [Adineta ricciae]